MSLAVELGANIAISADDTGGYGIDADFSGLPPGTSRLHAIRARYSTGPDDIGDLPARVFGAASALHGERIGLYVDYDASTTD
jgi:hypothetical protein